MDDLTERLATGDHPVIAGGSKTSPEDLQYRITEFGLVHIKFTETRGGTELGVQLDHNSCDLSKADFEKGTGTVHLEGTLTLNNDPVRCVADLELETLTGTGHLVPISEPAVA